MLIYTITIFKVFAFLNMLALASADDKPLSDAPAIFPPPNARPGHYLPHEKRFHIEELPGTERPSLLDKQTFTDTIDLSDQDDEPIYVPHDFVRIQSQRSAELVGNQKTFYNSAGLAAFPDVPNDASIISDTDSISHSANFSLSEILPEANGKDLPREVLDWAAPGEIDKPKQEFSTFVKQPKSTKLRLPLFAQKAKHSSQDITTKPQSGNARLELKRSWRRTSL